MIDVKEKIDFKRFYERVVFDTSSNYEETFYVYQNDTESRGFYVEISQDGEIVEPSEYESLTYYGRKPDGKSVFANGVIEEGLFRIDLKNQTFTVPGEVVSFFTLRGSNGETITKEFTIIVRENKIDSNPIESTDDFTALQQALAKLSSFAGEIEAVKLFSESVLSQLGSISTLTTEDKTSVVNALNEVNSKFDSILENENLIALLEMKADKVTIGNLSDLKTEDKTQIVSSINELFTSLQEVKDATNSDYLIPLILSKADKSTVGNIVDLREFSDGVKAKDLVDAINTLHDMYDLAISSIVDINTSNFAKVEDTGDKLLLTTVNKVDLVSAINEINEALKNVENVTNSEQLGLLIAGKADKSTVGNLSQLITTQKSNLVSSINELSSLISNIQLTPGPQGPPGPQGEKGEDGLDANVTSENIELALGYKPADSATIGDINLILDRINGEVI